MKIKFVFALISSFIIVAGSWSSTLAQSAPAFMIRGTLLDSSSKRPIEFATISILDHEKKVIALTYSDENGQFKSSDITSGAFFLNLSFIGYQQKTIPFEIKSSSQFEFGVIILKSQVNQLDAITITASKQLVEQQPGMLIYNAEKDVSNQGGTAADVLRKAPILNVDAAGKVTMRGNSNLRILINGKYSGQMARSPGDALNMMPAGSIKSVEVITSPSARYDAEGAAGVINIITKKGKQSTSGTIEAVIGNMEQALNPRIGINREKWNINSTLHLHRFRNKELTNLDRVSLENGSESGRIVQDVVSDNAKPHSSGELQVEYTADSANVLNFSLNGWLGRWPQNTEQRSRKFSGSGALTNEYYQSVDTKTPNRGLDFNLGYTHKLKKAGEELYLMAQHNRSLDDYDYNAFQKDTEYLLIYREQNINRTRNNEWTLQGDYVLPFSSGGKHAFESGVKAILRNVGSVYNVFESEQAQPERLTPVLNRSDRFDYCQDVLAAYSQLKLKSKNGWAFHFGARMEGTFLEGNQRNIELSFNNKFWNFVPSAILFKKLNANNNLTLSYTRRISRPSIWDLNPNRDTQNPNNIVTGNPSLRPEEVDQVEFTYALQTNSDVFINISLFGRKTANSIESIITLDTSGVATITKQNLASNGQYGVNLSTSFTVLPGWKVNGNANVRYAEFESGALNIKNKGMAWGMNVNSSWKLPDNYSVQVYGNFDARSVTLQGYKTAWHYYSFSAKKEIPSRKLTITLTAVSPFSNYISQSDIVRATDFQSTAQSKYRLRSVRLSINREFGSMFKNSGGRKINNDDLKNAKQGG